MSHERTDPMRDPWRPSGCERVRARMLEQLDGALPPLEAARDRGHLESCPACAVEAAQARAWLAALGAAAAPSASELAFALDGLDARLARARVPRPPRVPVHVRRRLVTGAALAAGALLGLILFDVLARDSVSLERIFARAPHAASETAWPAPAWPHVFRTGRGE